VVVDQLPPLTNLHRTLEELSISGQFTGADASACAGSPFVVELVAEARETLLRTYEGRWQEVADLQLRDVFVKETPEELKRLANMISIPKEMFEDPPPMPQDQGQDSGAATARARDTAWEALSSLGRVRSTASFFAAACAAHAPPDEVIILSAPPQSSPGPGDRLYLELRRSRQGQLGSLLDPGKRAVAGAALAAKQGSAAGETFAFACQISDNEAPVVRTVPFSSAKGASRTAVQLRALLEKTGQETNLDMYCNDVAEFSIAIAVSGEEGLSMAHVAALSLASP